MLGEQHWPPEIAAKFGLPAVILLWSCPHCHTTVSEPDLLSSIASQEDSDSTDTSGDDNEYSSKALHLILNEAKSRTA